MRTCFRRLSRFYGLLLCGLVLFAGVAARAGTTNLFNLTQVNGTSNGNVFAVPQVYFPPQHFLFQNLGITNNPGGSYLTNGVTNSITINIQASVDPANSNWITLATYVPTGTNPVVDGYNPTFSQPTLYMRAQIVTTNSLGVATFLSQ